MSVRSPRIFEQTVIDEPSQIARLIQHARYDVAADTGVSVPICVPADNMQVYLLDRNGNHVPMNMTGEMYIAGDGVTRGYLTRYHRGEVSPKLRNGFNYSFPSLHGMLETLTP
ncbi:MAG: hypothetical protein ACQEXX_30045 [Bacillota bacterium]